MTAVTYEQASVERQDLAEPASDTKDTLANETGKVEPMAKFALLELMPVCIEKENASPKEIPFSDFKINFPAVEPKQESSTLLLQATEHTPQKLVSALKQETGQPKKLKKMSQKRKLQKEIAYKGFALSFLLGLIFGLLLNFIFCC